MASITYLSYMSLDESAELSIGVTEKILTVANPIENDRESLPIETVKQYSPTVRELAHFVLFFVLGGLMLNAVSNKVSKKAMITTLIICVLYALFDEIFQECLQKGRSFDLSDLAKDFLGSACGILLSWGVNALTDKIRIKIRNRFSK